MQLKSRIKLLVFTIWFIGAASLLFLLGYESQRQFDPHLILSTAIMDLEFEKNFADTIELDPTQGSSGYIVHIGSSTNCACEFIAQRHQESIDEFSQKHNLQSKHIKIENYPKLSSYVPSTPAVAVFDSKKALKFFGPYSTGAGCFGTYGFVDDFLRLYVDKATPTNATIITDSLGCYCENKHALVE